MTNRHHPPKPTEAMIETIAEEAAAADSMSTNPLGPVANMAPVPSNPEEVIRRIDFFDEVYALKLAGFTYREIAADLTIKHKRRWMPDEVEAICVDVAKQKNQSLKRNLSAEIQFDLDRIDQLMKSMYPQALDGNIAAVKAIESLTKRKAEILGTDAAQASVSVSMTGDGDFSHLTSDELRTLHSLMDKAGMVSEKKTFTKKRSQT